MRISHAGYQAHEARVTVPASGEGVVLSVKLKPLAGTKGAATAAAASSSTSSGAASKGSGGTANLTNTSRTTHASDSAAGFQIQTLRHSGHAQSRGLYAGALLLGVVGAGLSFYAWRGRSQLRRSYLPA